MVDDEDGYTVMLMTMMTTMMMTTMMMTTMMMTVENGRCGGVLVWNSQKYASWSPLSPQLY